MKLILIVPVAFLYAILKFAVMQFMEKYQDKENTEDGFGEYPIKLLKGTTCC